MTAPAPRISRDDALIDAAVTRQRWERRFRPGRGRSNKCWARRAVRHIAHQLGCYPTWDAIEAEMVRRLIADETERAG